MKKVSILASVAKLVLFLSFLANAQNVLPQEARRPNPQVRQRLISPEILSDNKVTSMLYAPKADSVKLVCDRMSGAEARVNRAFMVSSCNPGESRKKPDFQVGAYYFDGWSGKHALADDPAEPWAKNVPRTVTKRMVEEFSDREPVWGWRDDSQAIMERQIDLAADNGIKFFAFCWYWRDSNGPINTSAIEKWSAHISMYLYLKAKNKNRIKFCLLVANHQGAEIKGKENWGKATEYWMKYFKDPQYVKVDGKPLVIIFRPDGIENESIARMQETAVKMGLKGLSIAGHRNTDGKEFTYRTHYNVIPGYTGGAEEHKYIELTNAQKEQWGGTKEQPYIPTVIVGWDKRPWERKTGNSQGWYYPDHTPEQFKNHLLDAISWMNDNPVLTPKERLVIVYAWNELGEGGYLVPTKGDPEASYLKVIKEVVKGK